MVFSSVKITANGKVYCVSKAKLRVRRYTGLLQSLEWTMRLQVIHISTIFAYYKVKDPISLSMVVSLYLFSLLF